MNASHPSDLDRRLARDPIAIVGLSALYPKSRDLHEFWANVVSAADCIEDVPASHWDVSEHYDPDPTVPDKTYSRRGGFIPTVDFNPLEFGLPPNTLEVTDVLQLLSLVVARDALKDAGADQEWYDASRTGVILGVTGANQLTQPLSNRLQTPVLKEVVRSCGLSERDAEEIAEKFKLAFAPWEENSFPGMLGNVVAGRIANRLDLGGTNMTVDAACASSLGAVKSAISDLLERRSDTMLVGGCDAENTIFMYLCFSKTPAFSKTGGIRPFDENADGTLIGEGIGMLALRRLSDAERDGNRIYAVVRGIGSSSDGRFKSIYAPRKEGQMAALRRAYEDADVSPDSIELFEAHGTGTAVGEATELSALSAVVSGHGEDRQFAAVGSVKSQIGHTKAAAGAAGMIKLALSLHHRLLPPTINVERPNPSVDWENSPFYVSSRTRPWIRDPRRPRRRAAVSAFGFGGTNFHVVMEEHGTGDDLRVLFPVSRVYVWHAPDISRLVRALDEGAEPAPAPAPAGHPRLALVARSGAELAELRALALAELRGRPTAESWSHPRGVYFRASDAPTGKVAALFAGQGSQYVEPGLTAVLALPPLRAAFDEANAAFGEHGRPLSRVAFPPPAFDEATRTAQESELRRTEYAQPAIGALAAGHYRYLTELGFEAEGFLGHSFGELAALWAAGALDDDAFFALARARGGAMAPPADAPPGFDPGAMAAVTAPEERVAELLSAHPELTVCNRNAPDQIVVGGATDAVERFVEAAGAAGVRSLRLPVSAAFHTPFVAHAVEAFGRRVDEVEIREPGHPVYANSPGAAYGPDVDANRRTLVEQIGRPVEFAGRVEEMYAAGFRTFVEFGPKGVLTRLVGRVLDGREHFAVQLDPGSGADADLTLKRAVAQLAVLGLPLTTSDRYVAEPVSAEPVKGMTVPLNGINHVPEARKAAYRDAIENGYRVTPGGADGPDGPRPLAGALPAPAAVPLAAQPVPALRQTSAPMPAPAAADTRGALSPVAVRTAPAAALPVPADDLESEPVHQEHPSPSPAPATAAAPADDRLSSLIADHLALHDDYLQGQLDSAQRMMGLLERADGQGRVDAVIPGVASVKEHGLAIGRTHVRANEILRDLAAMELGSAPPANPANPAAPAVAAGPSVTAAVELPATFAATPAALVPAPAPAAPAFPAVLPDAPAAPVAVTPPPAAAVPTPPQSPSDQGLSDEGPSEDDIAAALLDVVAQKTGYPAEMLELGMDVEADLGIDSIKRVEIMGVLQERFPSPTPVGPEQLGELRTLSEIVGFVLSLGSVRPRARTATAAAGVPASVAGPAPAAAVSTEDVATALLGVVAEKTGYPADMLDLGMDVEADLGIDSIKRVEIMGVLQERFPSPTPVGPEQLAELRTLNEIVGFVLELRGTDAPTARTEVAATASTATADDVCDALLEVVAAKTGYPADMLDLSMDVEADLGIDSIKRVEIMGVLQERFPSSTPVGPEQLGELRTLKDIVGFVTGLAGPASEPQVQPREQQEQPPTASGASGAPDTSGAPVPAGIGRGQAALVELPSPDQLVDAYPQGAAALVVDDGSEVARASAARLVESGWQVRVLRLPGVAQRVSGAADVALGGWGTTELASGIDQLGKEKVHLVLGFEAAEGIGWAEGVRRLAHHLLIARHLVGPLGEAAAAGGRAAFVTVTRLDGSFGLDGVAEEATPAGGVAGLVKTLAVEAPGLFCRALDLSPSLSAAEAAELVLEEAYDAAPAPVQVGRDGVRRVALTLGDAAHDAAHRTAGPAAAGLTEQDLLVVTGGGRGITAACVAELARRHRPGLLLLGRTPLDDEPSWADGVADAGLKAAAAGELTARGEKPTPKRVEQLYRAVTGAREIRATLAELRAAGSRAEYLAVDITDPTATAAALAPYRERVTGLVHGAGVLADQLIGNKKASEIERVFAPKLDGLRAVTAALPATALRHVLLFSSVAGFFGNRGQSDYAMANEVLNAWAASFKRRHPAARVTSLNWGAWDSGMVSPEVKAVFAQRGLVLIPSQTGARMFAEQFTAERAHDLVTVLGPTTPLSERETALPTAPVTVERALAGLEHDPMVADHVIGGVPVLPAAIPLGWALAAVERTFGTTAAVVRDFTVYKGIVFDAGRPERWQLTMTPAGDAVRIDIRGIEPDGTVRPRYGALVVPGAAPAAADVARLPAPGGGRDASGLYHDGTLFHGPSLRGVRRVLAEDRSRLVLECALPELHPASGAFDSSRFAPGTADLLLQAGLVWGSLFRDSAGLPLSVEGAELHRRLPDDEPFLVVVEPASADRDTTASFTITACTPDGQVLARLDGVSVVSAPQLAAKFVND
ncbi:SDR family NAD(P)-dependent oxidoreductase [Streptomyces sp. ME08-AFT2]|uniref:SDR family NAD(P)-dependent oxidoreductase n=1 Tax=Streptomyces sp. ME08-AFT2 TaxID=3028683 RepID=UPI0029B13981|nr:SDR family NAD(P)-dependent oxidoreductase [Streptomyces sp. ME08-AFT2]MDX3308673.1 SDR family NAD(P)-dependent oxidoreductase [Streptomyces sp. ME08-AFT2]